MITLRPIVESDADALFPLVYQSAVTDTLIWDGPESIEAYREALKVREERTLACEELTYLVLNEQGVSVGACGMKLDFIHRSGTIGLWLGLAFHGLGYGTETVAETVTIGFVKMKMERLEARIYVGNVASRRIFEKNGFQLEGTLRRAALKRGVFLDEWVMGAVRGGGGS